MMLRQAANEIRFHPGRFVATLLAVAISVGFIAAISTAVNTESRAVANANTLAISRADIVVTGQFPEGADVIGTLGRVDGVTAVGPAGMDLTLVTADDRSGYINLMAVPVPALRWSTLAEGRWPDAAGEVALSREGMAKLGLKLGDRVTVGWQDQPNAEVVGVTSDAKSLFSITGYASAALLGDPNQGSQFAIRTDGRDIAPVMAAIRQALPAPEEWSDVKVTSAAEARQAAFEDLTGDIDIFKYLLYGFAAIALVVGMIIIANTFTILLTQRRRQIGLLRAVGASTSQVRRRLIAEALLLGVIGSVLGLGLGIGVAALAATITGSIFWGLVLNPVELGVAAAVGIGATLLSVLGPSLAATRVKPLEALQAVPTVEQARRAGWARAVICALLAAGGVALILVSRSDPTRALVWAILAGALISVAVLAAAPLYVAPALRLLGRVFGFAGPTARLASENAARNPRRAAATTVALMLAVGLVVTLQVAVATIRTTGMATIDEKYPNDVVARSQEALPADLVARVQATEGVAATALVQSKQVTFPDEEIRQVRDVNAAMAALGLSGTRDIADGVIVIGDYSDSLGKKVTIPGNAGSLTLEVKWAEDMPWGVAAVSSGTFSQLAGKPLATELWIKLTDRTSPTVVNNVARLLETPSGSIQVEGGAISAGILTQVLNVIMLVLTALLGVAVLIALVGVGNTLGLSVIERQRESALLRALGMQRSGLRLMLLAEALLLAVVGVLVGVVAGAFFGWLGVTSAFRMMGDVRFDVRFGIDWAVTALLIVVCILAAGLASVLPGRRAANATPTEALAVE